MRHLTIVITDECFARMKAGTPEMVEHGDLTVHMSYLPSAAVKFNPTGTGSPSRRIGNGFYILTEAHK